LRVHETQGVTGADLNDLAGWWPQVESQFDGPVPHLQSVLIHWKGKTVVALYFEVDQVPWLVKNPAHGVTKGDPVELEVP
jgi:hypothetical protein